MKLTLPPAFGSAYVGELFACTLCINNELPQTTNRMVTSVKVTAEMQTPSHTLALELIPAHDDSVQSGMASDATVQKIVRFDLREEGSHVLSVSLSYSENTISKLENSASSGRVRSFRKLYQFIARPCLSVRTKASDLAFTRGDSNSPLTQPSQYVLEAQLENLADGLITLESLSLDAKAPFQATSLNWDIASLEPQSDRLPTLGPREVYQVAFFMEQQNANSGESELPRRELTKDGRTVLGILGIRWRNAMGDPGTLNTGWLTSKRR